MRLKGLIHPQRKIPKAACKHYKLWRCRSWFGYKTPLLPRELHNFINLHITLVYTWHCFWLVSKTGVSGPSGILWIGTTELSQVVYTLLNTHLEISNCLTLQKAPSVQESNSPYFLKFFLYHVGDAVAQRWHRYVRKTRQKSNRLRALTFLELTAEPPL